MPTEPQKPSRPRFTRAELLVLRDKLAFKRNGHYVSETNQWVYDNDLYRKVNRMLAARKPRKTKGTHAD